MPTPETIKTMMQVQQHHGYTNQEMAERINKALPFPIFPEKNGDVAYAKLKSMSVSNRYQHRQNAILNCIEAALKVLDRRFLWFQALERATGKAPTEDECYQAYKACFGLETDGHQEFCEVFGLSPYKFGIISFRVVRHKFIHLFHKHPYYDE